MKTCISLLKIQETSLLWKKFKTHLAPLGMAIGRTYFSVSCYGKEVAEGNFNLQTEFEKWAATPILSEEKKEEGLDEINIPAGLYAFFLHKGLPQDFPKTSQFIYQSWLPKSGYILDARPHFEVLDHRYKLNDPDSEEQVWIPVKPK